MPCVTPADVLAEVVSLLAVLLTAATAVSLATPDPPRR